MLVTVNKVLRKQFFNLPAKPQHSPCCHLASITEVLTAAPADFRSVHFLRPLTSSSVNMYKSIFVVVVIFTAKSLFFIYFLLVI